MAYKTFVAGEEALASDVNSYLMSQTVSRFASAAARSAALTAPATNQLSSLDDRVGVLQRYSGSAWVDMPGALVRWVASNPNVGVASPTDFTITSFVMPFAGSVAMTGQIGFSAGVGATALQVAMVANPSPASTPVPGASVTGNGVTQPANVYSGTYPFSALWGSVAAGVTLTAKVRVDSSASGTMGSLVNSLMAQFLIVPTLF
jgi:hypothetical protein